jgi:hypothetical protein
MLTSRQLMFLAFTGRVIVYAPVGQACCLDASSRTLAYAPNLLEGFPDAAQATLCRDAAPPNPALNGEFSCRGATNRTRIARCR